MDNSQILDRAQWGRMDDYFSARPSLISAHPDIDGRIQHFSGRLGSFDALAAQQAAGTGTFGAAKRAAIEDAAAYISKWGRRCSVRAHEQGLYGIEATLNHRPYEITHLAADEALNLMQAIRNALDANQTHFTQQGLNATVITTMDTKLSAVQSLINAPREAIDGHEDITNQLAALQDSINAELSPIIHLLEAEFEDTDAGFVDGLMVAYRKGKPAGKRYTGMEGTVKGADGAPAAGYVVSCAGLADKTATVDVTGHYAIRSMKPGTYIFEVKDTGGTVVQHHTIRVKQGTTVAKDWTV